MKYSIRIVLVMILGICSLPLWSQTTLDNSQDPNNPQGTQATVVQEPAATPAPVSPGPTLTRGEPNRVHSQADVNEPQLHDFTVMPANRPPANGGTQATTPQLRDFTNNIHSGKGNNPDE